MTSERVNKWISSIRGTPAEPSSEGTEDQGISRQGVGIIVLVVFAPVVVIVILKVLRDIRSSLG